MVLYAFYQQIGYEFPDAKAFWEEYKALRPASKSHPSCRLKDLIKEDLTENKDITIHKHHIIPYRLGGAGTPLNCIELKLYRVIRR